MENLSAVFKQAFMDEIEKIAAPIAVRKPGVVKRNLGKPAGAKPWHKNLTDLASKHPLATAGIGAGAGLLAGKLMDRE